MPLAFALKYFENYNYGRFPVLNKEHRLVGLISQRDVTRTLLYELTLEINRLEKKAMQSSQPPAGDSQAAYLLREWSVLHNDLENAGKAANDIKAILREHNVDRRLTRRIAVAAYELEINICIHSHGGNLTFMIADDKATVVAKDTGPGIPDVVWACQDGTSTANDWIRSLGFGAGMGLANSKRVSDRFDIKSVMGKGTTVTCSFNLKSGEE
jgi:anti-sigma regulatory factor (Ser/Thr protein kinase)